jgi:hypothetical protein
MRFQSKNWTSCFRIRPIRRWLIENDWLEAIVALPLNLGKLNLLQARVIGVRSADTTRTASEPLLDADHPENGALIPGLITDKIVVIARSP